MKKQIRKGLLYFTLGFTVFFLGRLGYGYIIYPNGAQTDNYQVWQYSNQNEDVSFSGRNYASTKIVRKGKGGGSAPQAQSVSVDQKYEKVASISSQSDQFEKDEKITRDLIKDFNALIQFEQNTGLKGHRFLFLAIGVDPSKFEDMTDQLSKLGKLVSIQVDKSDKTSEYKNLTAKKSSLEQTRNSLIALKSQGGKIDELINLETRILEIEEQIQGLGISLGEFDEENEFCTVKYTLREAASMKREVSFISRIKTALEWTIKWYFILNISIFLALLSTLLMSLIVRTLSPLLTKLYASLREKGNTL